MLGGSKARDIVRESYENAVLAGEWERRELSSKRVSMLRDDYLDQLVAALYEVVKAETVRAAVVGHVVPEHNVMRRIVDTISMVYSWGATRSVGADNAAYRLLLDECRINARLSEANRLCNACNEVLIRPVVRRGRMQLDLATPDMVTAFPTDDDPTVPAMLVVYRIGMTKDGAPAVFVDAWTDTQVQRYQSEAPREVIDSSGLVKLRTPISWYKRLSLVPIGQPVEHGYKDEKGVPVMPWVIAHRKEPTDSIWDETSGSGMVTATITVNLVLGLLRRLAKDQGELQLAWNGSPGQLPPKNQVLDALSILIGEGQWQVLNLQANPDLYLRQIDARLKAIALEYGIPPDSFAGQQANTSYAVMMQRAPLMEIRGRQIAETWDDVERQLVRAMAAVARKDHPTLRFSSEGFKVRFSDAPLVGSPMELEQLMDVQIKAGRLSPIDAIQMRRPELTREEALAEQERIAEDKRIWMDLLRETNAPADGGPGQSPEQNGAMGPPARDGQGPPPASPPAAPGAPAAS